MTTIDGTRAAGTLTIAGAVLDRLDHLAHLTGRSPSELVTLAVTNYAPPVEGGTKRPAIPATGEGPGDNLPPPVPVSTTLPDACVYCGERSSHRRCS